ncbi:hypothetical protein ABBQ32_010228 [Trebouxia sp. C0010 RCD-2024]
MGSSPFTPQGQPLMLEAGITKVAHLQAALQSQHPQAFTGYLQSILLALPPPWQAIAAAAPAAPAWHQGLSASGAQVIQHLPTRQQHSISPQHQLLPTLAQAVSALGPVHVIPWDPSRPCRGPTQQPAQPTAALYSQGQLWGPGHLSLGVWGWGQQPAHQLVVRQASQRLRLIQARKRGILAPGALTCQPRLLPLPGSGLTPTQLRHARLTASMDGPVKGPSATLVTTAAAATSSTAAATFRAAPAASLKQSYVGDTLDVLAPPEPSLRKLPRSIQFQGHIVSISVSRSLHSKTEQRNSRDSETLLKQQRRRAKQARRKVRRQRRALPPARDAADIDVTVAKGALELVASDVQVGSGEASTSGHEHVCGAGAIPSAGKKMDLESGSDSEPVVAGDTYALAIVPLTPDDDHGGSVRRSSREHKKPKPYFEQASTSLSVPRAKQGLKSGFCFGCERPYLDRPRTIMGKLGPVVIVSSSAFR